MPQGWRVKPPNYGRNRHRVGSTRLARSEDAPCPATYRRAVMSDKCLNCGFELPDSPRENRRIAELEEELDQAVHAHKVSDEWRSHWHTKAAELEQQLTELREVAKELADDVEAYANHERCARDMYPHIQAKWEQDMEPVRRARSLLKEQTP